VACAADAVGRPIPPMLPVTPVAPRIAPPEGNPRPVHVSEPTFEVSPLQTLLATPWTDLLTAADLAGVLAPAVHRLEGALGLFADVPHHTPPTGPLILLYDHPDTADFEHFRFSAAYPISRSPVAIPGGLELRSLPPMRVASVKATGPWARLHEAYPSLRAAVEAARVPFGPLTLERYARVGGTNDAASVTVVQREIGG
jgi:hypothetical protein